MKKLITSLLISFLLISSNAFSGNLYLIANDGTTWTSTPSGFDNVYKVNLSASGINGTTAVALNQWLTDRNATIAPTYLINGNAGVTFTTADQVWVAAGSYSVTANWTILTGSGAIVPALLAGGFAGTETLITDRAKGANAWNFTNETIINGSTSTTGIINAGGDRTITIDGLTFSGCPNNAGQAIYQRPNIVIQNSIFKNNSCPSIRYYTTTASRIATVTSCYFNNNNYTTSGGADAAGVMANNGSSGGTYTVSGCLFESNSSTASGSGSSAGIKSQGAGTVNINTCIFKNNSATAGGSSAVSLTTTTSNLTNCLIYGATTGSKSALYLTNGNVTNCTFVNNLGGGAYINQTASAANVKLTNTVFWGADGDATSGSGFLSTIANCLGTFTNCAYNGISPNFSSSPSGTVSLATTSTNLFTDPINNIWTLASGSSLIDAGTSTGAPSIDLVGTARPQGGGIDLGAYERTTTTALSYIKSLKWMVRNGNLIINEIDNNQPISIYNITGKKVVDTTAKNNAISVKLSKGIYIVKTNNTNTKVVIN